MTTSTNVVKIFLPQQSIPLLKVQSTFLRVMLRFHAPSTNLMNNKTCRTKKEDISSAETHQSSESEQNIKTISPVSGSIKKSTMPNLPVIKQAVRDKKLFPKIYQKLPDNPTINDISAYATGIQQEFSFLCHQCCSIYDPWDIIDGKEMHLLPDTWKCTRCKSRKESFELCYYSNRQELESRLRIPARGENRMKKSFKRWGSSY
jgi:hypothetical protein